MKEKDFEMKNGAFSDIEELSDDQLETVAGAGEGGFVSIQVCREKCFSNGKYYTYLDPICRGICLQYKY